MLILVHVKCDFVGSNPNVGKLHNQNAHEFRITMFCARPNQVLVFRALGPSFDFHFFQHKGGQKKMHIASLLRNHK